MDNVSYYDFSTERMLDKWTLTHRDEHAFSMQTEFESETGGDVLLLFTTPQGTVDSAGPAVREIRCNGRTVAMSSGSTVYIREGGGCRFGIELCANPGKNTLAVEGIHPNDSLPDGIKFSLGTPQSPVRQCAPCRTETTFPERTLPTASPQRDTTGFIPGVGTTESPGRFGFSKGDGVLDCAMPTLGTIDKMYLCGHPRYHHAFRWSYSTLPQGASHHGSYQPADHGIEHDDIRINHLSVRWGTQFGSNAYSCTYSLGSPGIITECDSGEMRLSGLEFAGNYQYVLIPRPGGKLEARTLRDVDDWHMGANYLLLFGCTEFPDLPLLLVFQKQPENVRTRFQERTNRLTEIVFGNCPLLISATPFGLESFQPIQVSDTEFLRRAVDRCRFWSRAFLAYPVRCEEYFRCNDATGKVTILQKFSYRTIIDEWGTEPLELAPLPPVTSLCGVGETDSAAMNFEFPTKYGLLYGTVGSMSSYTLPYLPAERKFPLRDRGDSTLEKLLRDGWESYEKFVTAFPDSTQAYPYAGALLEPFAFATTMLNFMSAQDGEKLREAAAQRLKAACDPGKTYSYPVINHGYLMRLMPDDQALADYYASPDIKHLKLWNWYERTEPFSGTKFHICYLNVGFFTSGVIAKGTPEEIANLKIPLIENDWGAGLTFYYMDLAAMASGDWRPIRDNWKLLKSVYSFFEKMHDWACLGSGYSDNAILWVEGANYGVYTAFLHMAQAIGDDDACQRGKYLSAKQFALRQGILRSAQHYFHRYYEVEPWYITRLFQEESNPSWQHQGVPKELATGRFRNDGVYNLTTEGLYPELFDGMRKFQAEDMRTIMDKLRVWIHENHPIPGNSWCLMQQTTSMLIDMALNPEIDSATLREEIELARRNGTLMSEWRGIHIFSRRLPKHYLEAQLLAWDAMKRHPLWLEHWSDLRIERAEWDGSSGEIQLTKTGPRMTLQLGIKKEPRVITLDGLAQKGVVRGKTLELRMEKSGLLRLEF